MLYFINKYKLTISDALVNTDIAVKNYLEISLHPENSAISFSFSS